jgi:hypothetical protein
MWSSQLDGFKDKTKTINEKKNKDQMYRFNGNLYGW